MSEQNTRRLYTMVGYRYKHDEMLLVEKHVSSFLRFGSDAAKRKRPTAPLTCAASAALARPGTISTWNFSTLLLLRFPDAMIPIILQAT